MRGEAMVERAADEAFDEFAARHGAALHRLAWVLTRHVANAEDLTQSTPTKTWRSWSRIETDPYAYARRVLVREFVSTRRRRGWGERPTEQLPETPAEVEAAWVDTLTLGQAIAQLPPAQRAVVILRYLEDLSVEDTGRALGITTGTVKSHCSRALAALRVSPELTDTELTHRERADHERADTGEPSGFERTRPGQEA